MGAVILRRAPAQVNDQRIGREPQRGRAPRIIGAGDEAVDAVGVAQQLLTALGQPIRIAIETVPPRFDIAALNQQRPPGQRALAAVRHVDHPALRIHPPQRQRQRPGQHKIA